MVVIKDFNGPIADMAISEWLSGCEDKFEDWEDENSPKKLSEKQKVHAAGNSISHTTPTDKLASWWTTNRTDLEKKKWNDFRDSVKEKALGSGWRVRALQNLYTASQGDQNLEDYFTALDNMRFVISRSSKLPAIETFEFKCHLLFHALPTLTTQALKNDIRDSTFANLSVDDVKDELRKYGDNSVNTGTTSTITTLSGVATAGMWIVGQAWGTHPSLGTSFTDLIPTNLPPTPQSLSHLVKILVYSNNDASYPFIQGYEMQFSGRTFKNPPLIWSGVLVQSLQFSSGEYITQIETSCGGDFGLSSLQITSSKGQSLLAGTVLPNKFTYKAPAGWRVVGFHGMANYPWASRYPMPSLGAICAPIV